MKRFYLSRVTAGRIVLKFETQNPNKFKGTTSTDIAENKQNELTKQPYWSLGATKFKDDLDDVNFLAKRR